LHFLGGEGKYFDVSKGFAGYHIENIGIEDVQLRNDFVLGLHPDFY